LLVAASQRIDLGSLTSTAALAVYITFHAGMLPIRQSAGKGHLMPRLLSLLGLALALAVSSGACALAAAAETLGIDLTAPQPQVDRLSSYAQGQPIDVRVTSHSSGGVALVGVSPSGSNVRVPLTREGTDRFAGSFTPGIPGTWSLAVASDATGTANATSSFSLAVDEPGASNAVAAVLITFAIGSIGVGIWLIAAGRRFAGTASA
jgi:hypothetical protein